MLGLQETTTQQGGRELGEVLGEPSVDFYSELAETFHYDPLNRVSGHSRGGPGAGLFELSGLGSINFQYDALGNLAYRSDVGSYEYATQAGPHAVSAIAGPEAYHKNASYTYDANGNQLGGDGRSVQWTSFNKPEAITRAGVTVTMAYGPERQRYRQVDSDGDQARSTTYVGGLYEKETAGGQVTHRYHIAVGGEVMAVLVDGSEELPGAHYFHRDHQSSIVAVTDENGYVIERYHYGAFGYRHRAVAADNDPVGNLFNAVTERGYTGHMHMAGVGLINMNGRLFDAAIGRFISADPFIQAPLLGQSYNRYSYVLNNPLKLVDPSGYLFGFFKKVFKKIKNIVKKVANIIKNVVVKAVKFVKRYWRPIAAITIAVVAPYALPAINPIAVGAIAGGLSGFVATGSLKGALIGAVTGAAFAGVGRAFGNLRASSALTKVKDVGHHTVSAGLNTAGRVAKSLAHGAVGGLSAAARGGKFVRGFLSAGVTQGFSRSIANIDGFNGDGFARVAAAAGVGGVTSELAGGEFANGAGTAAFLYTLRELPSLYEEYVGYKPDIRPGGAAVAKRPVQLPVKGANNVGTQQPVLDPNCTFCEGGTVSRVANQIPGINAVAGVHDRMQISLGTSIASNTLNVPLMLPAAAFAYSAILGQPLQLLTNQQLIYLSVYSSFNDDDDRRHHYAALAIGGG